jgi:hypothetical protein
MRTRWNSQLLLESSMEFLGAFGEKVHEGKWPESQDEAQRIIAYFIVFIILTFQYK